MSEIERARTLLDSSRNVVSFSGAGLSAESGIATFRDPQTGLWARYDPEELASPGGFARDPELVIEWYNHRRRILAGAQPNDAHRALAARADIVHVTQNVDGLLEMAGATNVLHLHGTIEADRCHGGCGYREPIDLASPPGLRSCPRCGRALRPAVVWFGEPLAGPVWSEAVAAVGAADTLLVVGTSGAVYPAAGLVDLARSSGAAVVIVDAKPRPSGADVMLVGTAAEIVPLLLGEKRRIPERHLRKSGGPAASDP